MRVLVTGGSGYTGSVTSAELPAAEHEVFVVDYLSTGHADAVPAGAQFHRRAITELPHALAGRHVDTVVHFAAKALVGELVSR